MSPLLAGAGDEQVFARVDDSVGLPVVLLEHLHKNDIASFVGDAGSIASDGIGVMDARGTLRVGSETYEIFRLDALQDRWDVARLPYSLRVLLENVLRAGSEADAEAIGGWVAADEPNREISFRPSRVIHQDFTGVPAIVDLAAMRNAMQDLGGNAGEINPVIPAELVIDHSVQVDEFATKFAFAHNVEREFERNRERYAFLRWGQESLAGLQVVPPGTGIVHQVNLEYLARVIESRDGQAFPDTLVGTDSHTTMVNGLGVLGWGVGGIEAEAAMLGEALSMLVPQVVGFRMTGALPEGATATDLVLTVTEMLRKIGVVGKFVEYFGPGLASLSLADRATLGNMSPEYGATCGFFPVDDATLQYLRLTGRPDERIALVEAYCKENMLWHDADDHPTYTRVVELDLGTIEPSIAGPRRPQDRVPLHTAAAAFREALPSFGVDYGNAKDEALAESFPASDPPAHAEPGHEESAAVAVVETEPAAAVSTATDRPRPRLRRDRRDHQLHEHLEPAGDGRRRPAREEGGRARPRAQALGEDQPRARLARRHRLLREGRPDRRTSTRSASTPSATAARPASGTPGRCRKRSRRRSSRTTSSPAPSSPATGTSRRASTPR